MYSLCQKRTKKIYEKVYICFKMFVSSGGCSLIFVYIIYDIVTDISFVAAHIQSLQHSGESTVLWCVLKCIGSGFFRF